MFSMFWDTTIGYSMSKVTYSKISEFVPNAVPMFRLLNDGLKLVQESNWVQKHERRFNPYAVKVGYSVLYYLQILRARQKAGVADGYEAGVLSRFSKKFSEEQINIPGFLYPYFCTLVACEPEDRKYNWVIPTYNDGQTDVPFQMSFDGTTVTYNDANGLGLITPHIPGMLMMLSTFGASSMTDLFNRMSSDRVYTPFDLTGRFGAFGLGNNSFNFGTAATGVTAGDRYSIFAACGMREKFEFGNDNYGEACAYMKSSSFYGRKGVNFVATGDLTEIEDSPNVRNTVDFTRIDKFLNMTKDQDAGWFEYVKEQMDIFCAQWKTTYNWSQVPTTGGYECSVITYLRTQNEVDVTNHRHLYQDVRCNINTVGDVKWSPKLFRNMTAHFESAKTLLREEELQALTFGVVSTPPVHGLTSTDYRRGRFYQDAGDSTAKYRLGNHASPGEGPKEMWEGWMTEVVRKDFSPKSQNM